MSKCPYCIGGFKVVYPGIRVKCGCSCHKQKVHKKKKKASSKFTRR